MPSPLLLLVEDSAEDAKLIVSALGKVIATEQIAVCESGEKALDYLLGGGDRPPLPAGATPPSLPRLVLLDLNLPRMGGFEVLRRIRNDPRTRLLPVVVVSASVEARDIRAATLAGANSYMRKSLDHNRMADHVQLLARYWLDLNIGPPDTPYEP